MRPSPATGPSPRCGPPRPWSGSGPARRSANVRIDRLRFKGEFPLPVRPGAGRGRPGSTSTARPSSTPSPSRVQARPRPLGPRCDVRQGVQPQGVDPHQGPVRQDRPSAASGSATTSRRSATWLSNDCRFEDRVRFWEARFLGWAEFKRCTFVGEADFRSFHADEGFILADCKFEGNALFRGATCCKKWDAGASTLRRAARPVQGQVPRLRLPRSDPGRGPTIRSRCTTPWPSGS